MKNKNFLALAPPPKKGYSCPAMSENLSKRHAIAFASGRGCDADPALRGVLSDYEPFSGTLARFFTRRLSVTVSVKLDRVERTVPGLLTSRPECPKHFAHLGGGELPSFVIGFDPSLAAAFIERLTGSDLSGEIPPMLDPTPFERGVIESICDLVARLLIGFWQRQCQPTPARLLAFGDSLPAGEELYVLSWRVCLPADTEESRGAGTFELYLPAALLEVVRPSDRPSSELRILVGRIAASRLPERLQPGMVIDTGLRPDTPFLAVRDGKTLFRVRVGEYHGEEAVEILSREE